jgi:thiamine pyrophosphokinase
VRLLLLLNGEVPDPGLALRAAAACDAVICADGGVRHAKRLKIQPRFVVGDMDSLPKPLPRWPGTTYVCDFDEDRSDLEKALSFCEQAGGGELWIAGALGGRLDHSLVNLAVLEHAARRLPLTLIDRGMGRVLGPGRHAVECRPGDVLSLLACGAGARVSFSGVRYPLRRHRLVPGSRGLSNVARGRAARLEVHAGRVWLLRP